jgi:proteasome lid subunit RPN8/RPN11
LRPDVLSSVREAYLGSTREVCGYLLGRIEDLEDDGDPAVWTVDRLLSVRNGSCAPTRFSIPSAEYDRVRVAARREGRAIRAVFHTHPDAPCRPSSADREAICRSAYPWVIAGRGTDAESVRLAAYRPPDVELIPVLGTAGASGSDGSVECSGGGAIEERGETTHGVREISPKRRAPMRSSDG